MRRIAIAILTSVCCLGVAQAVEKDDPALDKSWQATEPWFNPFPGNTILADVAENEPGNDTCPGQGIACGDVVRPAAVTAGNDDYFYFTASAGDQILLATDADGTPGVDTFLHLYNADCSTQLAADDDSGPGLYSLICFTIPSTGTYVARVRGYSATSAGRYKLMLLCGSFSNGETCARALLVPCGPVNLFGNTGCNVNDYTLPVANPCTGYTAAGRDVVLEVRVGAGSSLSLTYTSSADASIYVVDSCNPINCLAGADATLSGQPEVLNYNFPGAGTFYIILDSFGTNTSGSWTLTGNVNCGTVATEPVQWSLVKKLYR